MSLLRGLQEWLGPKAVRLSGRFNDHVRHSVLDNGITVVTQPRYIDRKLGFYAMVPVGSHKDPEGKEGLAHFLEHVILPAGSGTDFLEKGGYRNAATSSLSVSVHGQIENFDQAEEYARNITKEDVHDLARQIFSQPPSLTVCGDGRNILDLKSVAQGLRNCFYVKKSDNERYGLHL